MEWYAVLSTVVGSFALGLLGGVKLSGMLKRVTSEFSGTEEVHAKIRRLTAENNELLAKIKHLENENLNRSFTSFTKGR